MQTFKSPLLLCLVGGLLFIAGCASEVVVAQREKSLSERMAAAKLASKRAEAGAKQQGSLLAGATTATPAAAKKAPPKAAPAKALPATPCERLFAEFDDLAKKFVSGAACQSERTQAYNGMNRFGRRQMPYRPARETIVDYGFCAQALNSAVEYSSSDGGAYRLKEYKCVSPEQRPEFVSRWSNLRNQAAPLAKAMLEEREWMRQQLKRMDEGVSAANAADDLAQRRQLIDAGLRAMHGVSQDLLQQQQSTMIMPPAAAPTPRPKVIAAPTMQVLQTPQQGAATGDSCSKFAGVWARYAGKWHKDLVLESGCAGGEYCVQTLGDWNNAADGYGWHCERAKEKQEGLAGHVTQWQVSGNTLNIKLDTGRQLNFSIENRNGQLWVDDMIKTPARRR